MHKVWILDCKSCKTFLTNRAMKAVLLLRPSVPLYSTDALPVNCSAYSSCLASGTSSAPKTTAHPHPDNTRTCDCLTQTLCCHGCGTPVGYMIVVPCTRCTSSVLPPSPPPSHHGPMPYTAGPGRATNGHRFVFHSSEIVAEERLYIPGEAGVDADANPFPTAPHPTPAHTVVYPGAPYAPYVVTPPFGHAYPYHPAPPPLLHVPSYTNPHPHVRDHLAPDLASSPSLAPRDPDIEGLIASSNALFIHASSTVDRARRIIDRYQGSTATTPTLPVLSSPPIGTSSINLTRSSSPPSPSSFSHPPISNTPHDYQPSHHHPFTSFPHRERAASVSVRSLSPHRDIDSPISSQTPVAIPLQRLPVHHASSLSLNMPPPLESRTSSSSSTSSTSSYTLSPSTTLDFRHLTFTTPRVSPPSAPAPASAQVVPKLKEGDVLFWHHLIRRGELPGVEDDPRSRSSLQSKSPASSQPTRNSNTNRDGDQSQSQSQSPYERSWSDRDDVRNSLNNSTVENDIWCAR